MTDPQSPQGLDIADDLVGDADALPSTLRFTVKDGKAVKLDNTAEITEEVARSREENQPTE